MAKPRTRIGVLAHELPLSAAIWQATRSFRRANRPCIAICWAWRGQWRATTGAGRGGGISRPASHIAASPELVRRTLLGYVRSQEEIADRSAVRFLTAIQQSPKGMHATFQRFAQQTLFISQGADPYLMSHPMPRERVEALAQLAKASPYWTRRTRRTADVMTYRASFRVSRQPYAVARPIR